MALFDFLKRKKEVEKAKEKQPQKVEKSSAAKPVKKESKKSEKVQLAKPKKIREFSYEVIKEPHISEKSTRLAESNQYMFKVYANTNKPEIKKSVEGIYGVDVLKVNIIKIPNKKRRLGTTQGFKKGHTKAVVTIKEGQKIEVF